MQIAGLCEGTLEAAIADRMCRFGFFRVGARLKPTISANPNVAVPPGKVFMGEFV